jgi:hypothetical protein
MTHGSVLVHVSSRSGHYRLLSKIRTCSGNSDLGGARANGYRKIFGCKLEQYMIESSVNFDDCAACN